MINLFREEEKAGFTLTQLWGFEFTPFFDGVPEKDIGMACLIT